MGSIIDGIVKTHADLTLIVSLEHIDGAGKGRLSGLIKRAVKEAIKESRKLQLPPLSENKRILEMFDDLKSQTGWARGKRHPLTFVNFCLMILEDYNYCKISDTLTEIMCFFEQGGNAPAPCFWAGELAFKKWAKIRECH